MKKVTAIFFEATITIVDSVNGEFIANIKTGELKQYLKDSSSVLTDAA